ncbi:MAG: LPS export ABC transporter periplasmic protein LptC [Paludibacterium sp.]|uniref:LPS export ABC transporter periplasmic protein LptC n=1 Tax=Paludibacterium sp. TaxID=1917523 RepID=UPI0025E1ECA6|nr:LPS export ABC transporter periplasmic protein LptC [Paludibacterium sp.]MBV8048653.1 LPS export ABC transporter periplasmic protein LptC [Paludibacterium sp.]MBV8645933.1 LPS export ABC transporter periplasmic protein LptC [Paludibacterium sp.]
MRLGRPARLFPIALVLLMALLTIWLDQVSKLGSFGRDLDPSRPEFVSEEVDATRFDIQGRVEQRMVADKLWQYPNQNDLYFANGTIDLFRDGQQDYMLSAESGRYNTQTRIAFFDRKAHLLKPAAAGQPEVTLDSSAMTVDTARRYASSKQPTIIHYGDSVANATGFNYDYNAGVVNLLSSARATYVK